MNKLFKSIAIFVAILFLFSTISYGVEVDFKEQIKSEEGSLFEKIIAECIGGIAQTVLNFVTADSIGVGFKDYDALIFNNNAQSDSLSPFTQELWNKTIAWYKIFAIISGLTAKLFCGACFSFDSSNCEKRFCAVSFKALNSSSLMLPSNSEMLSGILSMPHPATDYF